MSPAGSSESRLRDPALTGYQPVPKGFGGSQLPKAMTLGAISKAQNTVFESKSALALIPRRMISS